MAGIDLICSTTTRHTTPTAIAAKQRSLALDADIADMPPAPPSAFGHGPSPSTPSGATPISHLSAEQEKVKIIRDAIRAEDKRLRAAYPFPLGHEWQDACGLAIYLGACCVWVLRGVYVGCIGLIVY